MFLMAERKGDDLKKVVMVLGGRQHRLRRDWPTSSLPTSERKQAYLQVETTKWTDLSRHGDCEVKIDLPLFPPLDHIQTNLSWRMSTILVWVAFSFPLCYFMIA